MTTAYGVEDSVFSGRFSKHLWNPDGVSVKEQCSIAALATPAGSDPIAVARLPKESGAAGRAWPNKRLIKVGPLAGPAVVCHEVAHVLAAEDPGHGWRWRIAYVAAVEEVLGDYHAKRLQAGFDRYFHRDQDRTFRRHQLT